MMSCAKFASLSPWRGHELEAQTLARQSIDSILNKAQLASKSDIDALNAKLNLINRKLDEVHAAHAEAAPAPPSPAPPFTDSTRE